MWLYLWLSLANSPSLDSVAVHAARSATDLSCLTISVMAPPGACSRVLAWQLRPGTLLLGLWSETLALLLVLSALGRFTRVWLFGPAPFSVVRCTVFCPVPGRLA